MVQEHLPGYTFPREFLRSVGDDRPDFRWAVPNFISDA